MQNGRHMFNRDRPMRGVPYDRTFFIDIHDLRGFMFDSGILSDPVGYRTGFNDFHQHIVNIFARCPRQILFEFVERIGTDRACRAMFENDQRLVAVFIDFFPFFDLVVNSLHLATSIPPSLPFIRFPLKLYSTGIVNQHRIFIIIVYFRTKFIPISHRIRRLVLLLHSCESGTNRLRAAVFPVLRR